MQQSNSHFFVYIFGEQPGSEVQVGIADDLVRKITESEAHIAKSVQQRSLSKLVYYEHYDTEVVALNREKQIKSADPETTANLVSSMNPNWLDLSDTLQ